jgi:hypothetical protein
VRPEGLGKFKKSPHRVSKPRPSDLSHNALTTTLPRAPAQYKDTLEKIFQPCCTVSGDYHGQEGSYVYSVVSPLFIKYIDTDYIRMEYFDEGQGDMEVDWWKFASLSQTTFVFISVKQSYWTLW